MVVATNNIPRNDKNFNSVILRYVGWFSWNDSYDYRSNSQRHVRMGRVPLYFRHILRSISKSGFERLICVKDIVIESRWCHSRRSSTNSTSSKDPFKAQACVLDHSRTREFFKKRLHYSLKSAYVTIRRIFIRDYFLIFFKEDYQDFISWSLKKENVHKDILKLLIIVINSRLLKKKYNSFRLIKITITTLSRVYSREILSTRKQKRTKKNFVKFARFLNKKKSTTVIGLNPSSSQWSGISIRYQVSSRKRVERIAISQGWKKCCTWVPA